MLKNKTCLQKFALPATDHFLGEKNGKKIGMKLSIAAINAETKDKHNNDEK